MRVLLPLLMAFCVSCSAATRARQHTERDTRSLGEAAGAYWLAVRWGDVNAASAFLETPAQQLQLGRVLQDAQVRVTEVGVLQVVVGEELPDARAPETREGVAVVRIEGYDVRSGRVEVVSLEQHWVRADRVWKVDAERSPVGASRAW